MDISNLYWWKPAPRFRLIPRELNLGDTISPYVVEQMLRRRTDGSVKPVPGKRVLALGSILHHANDGDIVWGSGINGAKSGDAYKFNSVDVRAVRGPVTAGFLKARGIDAPDVYGDPAILLPLFYEASTPVGERLGPLYIPHYNEGDLKLPGKRVAYTRGKDIPAFIDKIACSSIVYSASLHGIIVAEAYGVPAVYVSANPTETIDKYQDYYQGTGRTSFPIASSFEAAADIVPAPLPDLPALQKRLWDAFPMDAWR